MILNKKDLNLLIMNPLEIRAKRKLLGLTQKQLAEKLGVSGNTIINWEKGEVIPQSKYTILNNFLNSNNEEPIEEPKNVNFRVDNIEVSYLDGLTSSIMMVPLVNQYAYGSYLNGYGDPEYVESLPKIPFILDKEYKGQYLCFEMKGDSMDDGSAESLNEGDILLCRKVRKDYWKSKLHINQWDFVVVHKEKGVVAKRIVKHDVEAGDLTLHSLNDFYNDYVVNINDIDEIFNIVDVQKKRKRR